jgi:hypothetical protein
MKLTKLIGIPAVALGLSALASVTQAAPVDISGAITGGSGALISLAPPGTAFAGSLEWSGTLDGGQVTLGGFCFTDDASGTPPTSPTCGPLSAVPLYTTGQTSYNGTAPAPGSTFQQAGTTFDGTSGLLKLTAFSPTFNVNIYIDLLFAGDGTGTLNASTDFLGDAQGTFAVASAVPVPAAAWLFGSALVGLAGVGRSRKAS